MKTHIVLLVLCSEDMFKELYLSYYNQVDIKILKECKTIVPVWED